jgi:integrase
MPRKRAKPKPVKKHQRQHGRGSVYSRADGRVVAAFPAGDGRSPRYWPRGTDPEVARRWLDAQLDGAPEVADDGTLAAGVQRYAARHAPGWDVPTRENFAHRLKRLAPLLPLPLEAIDEATIRRWLDRLATHKEPRHVRLRDGTLKVVEGTPGGYAPRTLQRLRGTLAAILEFAVDEGRLQRNPERLIPKLRRQLPPPQAWNLAESRRFLAALSGHPYEALLRFSLETGARRGELLGLRWDDVDLDNARCQLRRIRRAVAAARAIGPMKSRREREVDLTPRLVWLLRKQKARLSLPRQTGGAGAERSLSKSNIAQPSPWVFPGLDGNPLGPTAVARHLDRLIREVGLPRVTPHGLRHTLAGLLIEAGHDPMEVAQQLGHANPAITLGLYSQGFRRRKRRVAQTMARLLEGDHVAMDGES